MCKRGNHLLFLLLVQEKNKVVGICLLQIHSLQLIISFLFIFPFYKNYTLTARKIFLWKKAFSIFLGWKVPAQQFSEASKHIFIFIMKFSCFSTHPMQKVITPDSIKTMKIHKNAIRNFGALFMNTRSVARSPTNRILNKYVSSLVCQIEWIYQKILRCQIYNYYNESRNIFKISSGLQRTHISLNSLLMAKVHAMG